jgi:hypothetical protein
MDRRPDDASMFLCDCPTCGRRELRGARSLHPLPVGDGIDWIAHCRACGEAVTIVAQRPREGRVLETVGDVATAPANPKAA